MANGSETRLEYIEKVALSIMNDLIAISSTKQRDLLMWYVSTHEQFSFNNMAAYDHSVSLVYKFDDADECDLVYKKLKNKLAPNQFPLNENPFDIGKLHYIIFRHPVGIRTSS